MHARTLLFYLNMLTKAEPDKRLLGCEERWLTAAEVLTQRDARAAAFHRQGITDGDWVALRAERNVDTALSLLALRALGAVVVLCDPRQEPAAALNDCDIPIPVRASVEDCTVTLRETADSPVASRDAAFVIFTSGSTGKSKAVVLSEKNLISNLLYSAPFGCYFEDDIALGALPLHHVFGLVLLVGTVVLNYALFFPRETGIPALLTCIERERITRMNGVPSLYLALAEQSAAYDLRSLRAGFIGGGPVTAEQFARIEDTLGLTLIPVYGMSECIGISCASWRDPQDERAAGVGRVYPMNEIRLLTDDGREAAPGHEGEICVRGPMRMLGYVGDPLPSDAFFPTGDLGYFDEVDVLHLSGRKKDIIIRNGNNLSARRIEEALLRLPGVREAAVLGLPDEREGEAPYAMVAGVVDRDALHALLHKNEWPAGIYPVEALPRLPSGKCDRQRIREVLLQWRSL